MITIRPVTENDIVLLTELGRTTFIESFSEQNNPVNVQKYLTESYAFEVIKVEFDNPKNHFFIAEFNSEPAGFIKIIFDEDEDHPILKDKKCLQLKRIYILEKFQSLGISRKMLNKLFEIAIENHFELIWLGVWEKNIKAITVYEKWGFEKFGSHIFNLGGDLQTDLLMKKFIERQKN